MDGRRTVNHNNRSSSSTAQDKSKNKLFNVLHENNNLYATSMYFLEAPIFNGEDDVSLTRKRRSISGKHSLRIVVNAVRYVVRINSRACLCN